MRPLVKVLLGVVALFGVLTIGATAWVAREVGKGSAGAEVHVTVPVGASTQQIAALLDDRQVIESARFFRVYLRLKREGGFKAGDYTFRRGQGYAAALGVLNKGPGVEFVRLTIPEGLTLKEIAAKVGALPGRSAARFLEVAQSGAVRSEFQPAGSTNLEGLLFPDTYFIDPKDDETKILTRLVAEFDQTAAEVGLGRGGPGGLTPYETAIVASLVESEGKVAADRPKIAEVIYNRLEQGMLLQIDATVIYANGGERRPNGQVLFKDLEVDSPYNTYKRKGLPPTPIASMGRAAIRAAVAPEAGPWLFYVKAEADGTHKFAVTGAEHNRNVADARRRGVIP